MFCVLCFPLTKRFAPKDNINVLGTFECYSILLLAEEFVPMQTIFPVKTGSFKIDEDIQGEAEYTAKSPALNEFDQI